MVSGLLICSHLPIRFLYLAVALNGFFNSFARYFRGEFEAKRRPTPDLQSAAITMFCISHSLLFIVFSPPYLARIFLVALIFAPIFVNFTL